MTPVPKFFRLARLTRPRIMLRFIKEWVRYTCFFFGRDGAPPRKWHTYFASAWRTVHSILYSEDELAKCQNQQERNFRLAQLLRLAVNKAS